MHSVTLLTSPERPHLEPVLVDSLRNAWGGGDAVWLAPDEAATFEMKRMPGNRWDVWAECQGMGVDLVITPAEGRRKKMLLADMDSTIIQQECIDELADEAGVGGRVKDITARAMNGELDFEAALRERVALLKGLDEAVIGRVLSSRISHMPGSKVLLPTARWSRGGLLHSQPPSLRRLALTRIGRIPCWSSRASLREVSAIRFWANKPR